MIRTFDLGKPKTRRTFNEIVDSASSKLVRSWMLWFVDSLVSFANASFLFCCHFSLSYTRQPQS